MKEKLSVVLGDFGISLESVADCPKNADGSFLDPLVQIQNIKISLENKLFRLSGYVQNETDERVICDDSTRILLEYSEEQGNYKFARFPRNLPVLS